MDFGVINMAVEPITSCESYEKLELSIWLMIPPNNPDRRQQIKDGDKNKMQCDSGGCFQASKAENKMFDRIHCRRFHLFMMVKIGDLIFGNPKDPTLQVQLS